jgi:cob(I)alamin adenosyltransferase
MGQVYLYYGSGGGKTTNALGLALRSVGHGNKVIIIQFMKGRKDIGEYKIGKRLHPDYEIYQFGSEEWVDLKNPSEEDKRRAREGLSFAQKTLQMEPNLLILDEIGLATYYGLLETNNVLELLRKVPKKTDIVITGRRVPKELIDRADFVNEVIDVKHPKEMPTVKGIHY